MPRRARPAGRLPRRGERIVQVALPVHPESPAHASAKLPHVFLLSGGSRPRLFPPPHRGALVRRFRPPRASYQKPHQRNQRRRRHNQQVFEKRRLKLRRLALRVAAVRLHGQGQGAHVQHVRLHQVVEGLALHGQHHLGVAIGAAHVEVERAEHADIPVHQHGLGVHAARGLQLIIGERHGKRHPPVEHRVRRGHDVVAPGARIGQ